MFLNKRVQQKVRDESNFITLYCKKDLDTKKDKNQPFLLVWQPCLYSQSGKSLLFLVAKLLYEY